MLSKSDDFPGSAKGLIIKNSLGYEIRLNQKFQGNLFSRSKGIFIFA